MAKAAKMIGMVGILICTGCASIVSRSQYPVTISSSPSAATVTVKNKRGMAIHKATTPVTLSLRASSGFFGPAIYSFQFQKDGYYPASSSISASIDPWYIGNIIFGGLIGILIVDPATGAMWKLDDIVYANLSESPSGPTSQPQQNDIPSQLKKLKELKEDGILTEEEYETRRKALIEKL